MLLEYWELGRSELNTPGDMGGEKNDRVAGDPHRRLRVKIVLQSQQFCSLKPQEFYSAVTNCKTLRNFLDTNSGHKLQDSYEKL